TPPFFEFGFTTVRDSPFIEPCPFIKGEGMNDEGVAFPFTHRVTIPERPLRNIVWNRAAIGPDDAPDVNPFEKLHRTIRKLNDFERPIVDQSTVKPRRIGTAHRIVSEGRRNGARSLSGLIGIELLETFGREW